MIVYCGVDLLVSDEIEKKKNRGNFLSMFDPI